LARRAASRNATIAAATTLSSATAPARAKTARICLSNVNHHGKIFPDLQCIERMDFSPFAQSEIHGKMVL
jgi:hypothetical protein